MNKVSTNVSTRFKLGFNNVPKRFKQVSNLLQLGPIAVLIFALGVPWPKNTLRQNYDGYSFGAFAPRAADARVFFIVVN